MSRNQPIAALRPTTHRGRVWTGVVGAGVLMMAAACLGGCAESGDHTHLHHHPPADWNPEFVRVEHGELGQAEYPDAIWNPASSTNYTVKNRGKGDITVVVVHTVQGSYNGCISWFKNPSANVSAHYVVSKTGEVTQMVKEKDMAWHVASQNPYTIGIEHEGWVDDPDWATEPMLKASAKLTCYLIKKYGLTATKTHIKGHVELPKQTHTDPGKYWPWDKYLDLVEGCGEVEQPPAGCCNTKVAASGATVLDNKTAGCFQQFGTAAYWHDGGGYDGGAIWTYTADAQWDDNWARWRLGFDQPGEYTVEVHVPNDNAETTVTYTIKANGKEHTKAVNQGADKGWVTLGTWDFGNTCDEYVKLGDAQGIKGKKVAFDAIRVSPKVKPCPGGCDDGNPCTTGTCNDGTCAYAPVGVGACDDGDACTVADACKAGGCVGVVQGCTDGDACTADACEAGACLSAPTADASCAGVAEAGLCFEAVAAELDWDGADLACRNSGGRLARITSAKANGAARQAANQVCPGEVALIGLHDRAAEGSFVWADGTPLGFASWADGEPNNFGASADDPGEDAVEMNAAGQWNDLPHSTVRSCYVCTREIDAGCDDGDPCTVGDGCGGAGPAGGCGGQPKDCDDGDACTEDSCDTLTGACLHTLLRSAPGCAQSGCADDADCDDGDACSVDACAEDGSCSNTPLDCDDGDPCTTDVCQAGACGHWQDAGCGQGGGVDAGGGASGDAASADAASADAAAAEPGADANAGPTGEDTADRAPTGDTAVQATDSGQGGGAAGLAPASPGGGGCSSVPGRSAPAAAPWWLFALVCCGLWRARRRRDPAA